MRVLTLVDVTGIQRFIFGSGRLRQVAGASALLNEATSDNPGGWLHSLGYRGNIIMAGGGNALLVFSEMDEAMQFAARFSRQILLYAPELEAVIVHEEFDNNIGKAVSQVYQRSMPQEKAKFLPRGLILNLGISEECSETGQAASEYDKEGNPISAVTWLKDQRGGGHIRFDELIAESERPVDADLRFPLDINALGRTREESSLIGIVHMDANNTGARIGKWLEDNEDLPDDKFIERYRSMSRGLDTAVRNTMKAVVERVCRSVCKDDENPGCYQIRGKGRNECFELCSSKEGMEDVVYLPIRPIIAAGEDITFVCDGRFALDLTATALEEFERQDIPELGRLTACAGVSMVHAHSPFIRAYGMAEQLCGNAKRFVRETHQRTGQWFSAIDWHIDPSGGVESLSEVRKGLQKPDGDHLTAKPYLFMDSCKPGSWKWFVEEILYGKNGFLSAWCSRKSKLQTLKRLVAEERHEIRKTLSDWALTSGGLSLPESLDQSDGFVLRDGVKGRTTPIIDAVELDGLFVTLDGGETP